MTSRIVPCLWFDDQAELAAARYAEIFLEGRILGVSHYPEAGENPSGRPPGSVLTVEFVAAGQRFTALNGGPLFIPNPSISFFVHVDSAREADRVYGLFADRGTELVALGAYPWSERYGWVQDRFGVSWQVLAGRRTPGGATIVPCLMFSGAQHGRAEEAMRVYAAAFEDGHVVSAERYEPDEGPQGTVKHGRFVIGGQEMAAMDSHIDHGFGFNEAISLQLMCKDQPGIDHKWRALSDGGEEGPCGWLKDRFGVSWQVVPEDVATWMTSGDREARDRAFAAMLQMKKLDLAALRRAYAGA